MLQWKDQKAREKWSTWGAEEVKKRKKGNQTWIKGKMEPEQPSPRFPISLQFASPLSLFAFSLGHSVFRRSISFLGPL